jgi:hypothetical protein
MSGGALTSLFWRFTRRVRHSLAAKLIVWSIKPGARRRHIPANIAEGCGRETNAELRRFLYIAMGSASELDYHLLLAHDLNYLDAANYQRLNDELNIIRRMLNALIQKLRS